MGTDSRPTVVTLVGPKHTGKTSAGKALARLIGGRFVDMDDLIESRTGRTPRALYEEGVEVFRAEEAQAAKALTADSTAAEDGSGDRGPVPLIVAAGGGLVDNPEALEALRAIGRLVSLRVKVKTAWDRVCASAERTGSFPPFLRGKDPEGTHRVIHERRTEAYGRIADFEIDAEDMNPADLAEEIAHTLSLKRIFSGRNRA
jgi:shikimate kinase